MLLLPFPQPGPLLFQLNPPNITTLQPRVRAAVLWKSVCGEEPVAEAEQAQHHSALWGRREAAGDHTWSPLWEDPEAERNTWGNEKKKKKGWTDTKTSHKRTDRRQWQWNTHGQQVTGSRNERLKVERMHVCCRNKYGKEEWQTEQWHRFIFLSWKEWTRGKHAGIKVEMETKPCGLHAKAEPLTSNTQVFSWAMTHTHFRCINTRPNGSWCRGDISNMQDAGISLERSAAAGEGQRGLSCQSCMQQAVQYITSTNPTSHSICQQGIGIQDNFYANEFHRLHYKIQHGCKVNFSIHRIHKYCVTQVRSDSKVEAKNNKNGK